MQLVSKTREFRRSADRRGLSLRTADADEPRFVFVLKAGEFASPQHPTSARDLLQLADDVFGADEGEAFELRRLVARREDIEEEAELPVIIWQSSDRVYAALNPEKWVRFDVWIADQHLIEDALMLDGPWDHERLP